MSRIKVNGIGRKGQTMLVQYADENGIQRVLIPPSSIDEDGTVDEVELSLGIPYGLPWAEIVQFKSTPETLANELRRRGIWTGEDMRADPSVVVGAFQAVCGVDASRLRVLTARYEKEKGGQDNDD